MLTALALAHPFAHGVGFGFFPFFFLIPLFWIGVVVLIVVLLARGRRRRGVGPWAGGWGGPWAGAVGGPWAAAQAARSAESTLAERFAQGDIDEVEYRARLEVLRANAPQPPQTPQG